MRAFCIAFILAGACAAQDQKLQACVNVTQADAVFIADIIGVEREPGNDEGSSVEPAEVAAKLSIVRTIKGDPPQSIRPFIYSGCIGRMLEAGKRYLFFSHHRKEAWFADSSTIELGLDIPEDLAFLAAAAARDDLTISGVVQSLQPQAKDSEDSAEGEPEAELQLAPARGIEVIADDGHGTTRTFTDSEGKYNFPALDPVKHRLWFKDPAKVLVAPTSYVAAGSGCRSELTTMMGGTVVEGVLSIEGFDDEDGIQLFVEWHGADEEFGNSFVGSRNFAFPVTTPKTFAILISLWNKDDHDWESFYYPGTTDVAQALLLHSEPGDEPIHDLKLNIPAQTLARVRRQLKLQKAREAREEEQRRLRGEEEPLESVDIVD